MHFQIHCMLSFIYKKNGVSYGDEEVGGILLCVIDFLGWWSSMQTFCRFCCVCGGETEPSVALGQVSFLSFFSHFAVCSSCFLFALRFY